jgi:hypothetical protein
MATVKVDLNELAKSTAIVVARRFGVTKRFHDWIGGENFLLDLGFLRRAAHVGKVTHRVLGADGFARARLTANYNGLILFETFRARDVKIVL